MGQNKLGIIVSEDSEFRKSALGTIVYEEGAMFVHKVSGAEELSGIDLEGYSSITMVLDKKCKDAEVIRLSVSLVRPDISLLCTGCTSIAAMRDEYRKAFGTTGKYLAKERL